MAGGKDHGLLKQWEKGCAHTCTGTDSTFVYCMFDFLIKYFGLCRYQASIKCRFNICLFSISIK